MWGRRVVECLLGVWGRLPGPGAQWAFPAKVPLGRECLLGLTPSWFPWKGSYLLAFPKVDCARR